jgi:hypothetical protein
MGLSSETWPNARPCFTLQTNARARLNEAQIRQPVSIRELTLALAHRWEPERYFVFVYTGYLDESGTHGGSPATVMGGFLGRAQQWEKFEKGFAKAQKEHGFRVWHSKKFKRRDGDFKGWTDDQCQALYWDLAHLTSYGLTDSVVMNLNNADFEKYYWNGDKPRRARLDTKYGYCFRCCLLFFIKEVIKRKFRKTVPHLHIVLEAGHKNVGDAERIFWEVKKEWDLDFLRTITKAEKDSCGQLMMADFTAHSEYLLETKLKPDQRDRISQAVPKGMTGLSHLQSTPEALAKNRAEIIEKATPKKDPNAVLHQPPASGGQPS